MGYNYNQATLMGRLTKDPEFKQISESFSVCNFTLAINRSQRYQQDEQNVDFIPVSLLGRSAALADQLLKKSSPVLVWGRIQVRHYEQNSQRRWITELIADNFQVLSRPNHLTLEPNTPPISDRSDKDA